MPAFIPWLLAAFFGGLRFVAGSIVAQALIGIGVGVVTYTGVDVSFNYLKAEAFARLGELPAEVLQLLAYAGVGSFLNIVFSAYMMRLSMTAVRNAAGLLAVKRFFKL